MNNRTLSTLRIGVDGVNSMEYDADEKIVVLNDTTIVPIGSGMQLELDLVWTKKNDVPPSSDSSKENGSQAKPTAKQPKQR